MLKNLMVLSACLLLASCASTTPPLIPQPPTEAMTNLGMWTPLAEGLTEEEAALIFVRNQELSLEWRYKALLLQDYAKQIGEIND